MNYTELEQREKDLGLHISQGRLNIRGPDHIDEIVAYIETCKADNESAHYYRDELALATLRAIADSGDDAAADLAKRALKADEIAFSLWYA